MTLFEGIFSFPFWFFLRLALYFACFFDLFFSPPNVIPKAFPQESHVVIVFRRFVLSEFPTFFFWFCGNCLIHRSFPGFPRLFTFSSLLLTTWLLFRLEFFFGYPPPFCSPPPPENFCLESSPQCDRPCCRSLFFFYRDPSIRCTDDSDSPSMQIWLPSNFTFLRTWRSWCPFTLLPYFCLIFLGDFVLLFLPPCVSGQIVFWLRYSFFLGAPLHLHFSFLPPHGLVICSSQLWRYFASLPATYASSSDPPKAAFGTQRVSWYLLPVRPVLTLTFRWERLSSLRRVSLPFSLTSVDFFATVFFRKPFFGPYAWLILLKWVFCFLFEYFSFFCPPFAMRWQPRCGF